MADDLQRAYDHFLRYGPTSAKRFLASYEHAVAIISEHPWAVRARPHGWRQMPIAGFPTYALFYRELEKCWLLAGLLPCVIDPDTLQAQLLLREVRPDK